MGLQPHHPEHSPTSVHVHTSAVPSAHVRDKMTSHNVIPQQDGQEPAPQQAQGSGSPALRPRKPYSQSVVLAPGDQPSSRSLQRRDGLLVGAGHGVGELTHDDIAAAEHRGGRDAASAGSSCGETRRLSPCCSRHSLTLLMSPRNGVVSGTPGC